MENLIIVYLGASYVIDGSLTVGVLMAFMAYKNQFGGRVSSLIDKFIEVKMLSLHSERLADIVLTQKDKQEFFNDFKALDNYDIEVNNISFRYNDNEPNIIKNLSFKIQQNTSVAIVGATGCGKSTLMSLLLGELSVSSGEIKIGGKIIKTQSDFNYLNCVACVSQDDVLFAGSLLENISFFDKELDVDWAMECAKMADIYDEIIMMPMGSQTLVGDMGSVLSGGQKQRIFIARALYQKPKILLMDEATSHLSVPAGVTLDGVALGDKNAKGRRVMIDNLSVVEILTNTMTASASHIHAIASLASALPSMVISSSDTDSSETYRLMLQGVEKEHQINQMIKSLNITRILIAHRPQTIQSADRVIKLD